MLLSEMEEKRLVHLSQAQKNEIVYDGKAVCDGFAEYDGKADLALLLGGQPRECQPRAITAAKLYNEGRVRYIMPTGGVAWDTPFGNMSEAQLLSQYMLRAGVPQEAIIMEEMATNTKENMLFAAVQIIRRLNKADIRKMILVTSNFHMRRSMAIAKCYLPKQYEIYPVCAHGEDDFPCLWYKSEYLAKRVDIELINLYRDIKKGVGDDIIFGQGCAE